MICCGTGLQGSLLSDRALVSYQQTKPLRSVLVILLLSVLAACKTLPEGQNDSDNTWLNSAKIFESRQNQYSASAQWRYSAKVGLSAPQVRESANLIWEYSDQANNVRLFGPLGVGAVRLQFDPYGVEMSDNKGVLHRGDSAEQLLTDIVGWPIPIDALSRWLFVLPTDNAVFRYQIDENNNVVLLEQLGWKIEYSDYKTYGERFLPRKITATKTLPENQSVVVKLITKAWR